MNHHVNGTRSTSVPMDLATLKLVNTDLAQFPRTAAVSSELAVQWQHRNMIVKHAEAEAVLYHRKPEHGRNIERATSRGLRVQDGQGTGQ